MKYILPLLFCSLSVLAQNKDIQGVYKFNLQDTGELHLNSDNTYNLTLFSGSYSLEGDKITFTSAPNPSFELHKEEGKSSQLELTFYVANELGNYIYVGYENAKGEVTYTALTALHPVKYSEALRVTIPRTEYLYLVDTQTAEYVQQFMERQSNTKVKVEKFAIGKQTNALKINYLSRPHNMLEEVDFVYDAPTQSLVVADEHIDSIALFKKKNRATSPQFPLVSINPLPNWQQQLHKASVELEITPEKTLKEALQKAKKEQQLLVILTATEGWNEKLVNYLTDKYSKDWEEDDDSEETPQITLPYVYYIASRKDHKWLKKHGFSTTTPQLIVVGENETIVYSQPIDPEAEYFNNAMDAEVYQAIELARKVDKTLTNPQAPIAEVLQVMNEVFQVNYKVNLYYLLPKVAETDEEDQTDYFLGLQPERIYRLQLTPAQLATQWERLVAHYNEKKPLNQSYYSLLARNFGAASLSHKIFNTPNPLSLTDYKAICYLVENYSAVKDEKIDVYSTSLYRTIKELATNKVVPFKELQHTLLAAEKQQLLSLNNLVDFYKKYTPNELTSFFVTYFNALKAEGGGSVLAALDKRFEQQKENSDWKRYKYQFALVANNIAWKVFEEENTDVSKVTQAVEWAKIAADLVPENPFMLDTLACLLYTQGDKVTALSIQQKAVKLMKVLVETEEESVSELKEMEKHLSIFNAK